MITDKPNSKEQNEYAKNVIDEQIFILEAESRLSVADKIEESIVQSLLQGVCV